MILVDHRAGSCELLAPLTDMGIPAESTELEFGDLAFLGRGEGGAPTMIGLEHKKLPDLVQSLKSDRLAGHQLIGMLNTYERPYLIIEGDWSVDTNGRVVVWRGRKLLPLQGCPPAQELLKRVFTLETRGGLRVYWSRNRDSTIQYVMALYRYWSDRDLDSHKSHLAIHAPDLDRTLRIPISDFRKGLNGLCPGIGLQFSRAIEQRVFDDVKGEGSMRQLMALGEQALADISIVSDKGRTQRFGAARAKKLLAALR